MQALESGYKSSEDGWMFRDFMEFMELTDDYLRKEAAKDA